MKFRLLFDAIQRSGHTGTLVAIWSVALIAAGGAAFQARKAVESFSTASQAGRVTIPEIRVVNTPLAQSDYEAIVQQISRLHPDIEVRAEADGLVILMRINAPASFDRWRLAVLDAMQSINAQWKTDSLCVGVKCPESPYKIKLSAYRASAQVK